MSYAALLSTPKSVKAMLFGFMSRREVEKLVRDVREDMYRSNVESFDESCQRIAAIVNAHAAKGSKRPAATGQKPTQKALTPEG